MVNPYQPTSLSEALDLLAREPLVPYAGGTDLMVCPKRGSVYLFLNRIPELRQITEEEAWIRIGASCTFTDLLECDLTPGILKKAASLVAAPAIRNLGTVGGNICNGSPKADCALALVACDAQLRLASSTGERILPLSEFYLGSRKTALHPGELLTEILVSRSGLSNYYYEKVGTRGAMTIARVSFAAILEIVADRILRFSTAFGAIGDGFLQRKDLDAMLIGKTIREAQAIKASYLDAYDRAIVPISGRTSAEYRKFVCNNLLRDFLDQNGI